MAISDALSIDVSYVVQRFGGLAADPIDRKPNQISQIEFALAYDTFRPIVRDADLRISDGRNNSTHIRGLISIGPQIFNNDTIDKTKITCIERNIRIAQCLYQSIMRFSR
jgi:hypothetical protein